MSMDQIVRMSAKDVRDFCVDMAYSLGFVAIIAVFYVAGIAYSALCLAWVMEGATGDPVEIKQGIAILLVFQLLTGSIVKPEDIPIRLFVWPSLAYWLWVILENVF